MSANQLRHRIAACLTSVGLCAAGASGCGGTTTGNPEISIGFGGYSNANWFMELLMPSAYASVLGMKLCFKRVRFKADNKETANRDSDNDNRDFDLGEVLISPNGTTLGSMKIPAAVYRRVEFDLDTHCASGKSVQFTNASGSFSSTKTLTIKFEGTMLATRDGQPLTLAVQKIVNALNVVNTTDDLETQIESVHGDYDDGEDHPDEK